jgi:hypothetical protein
MSTDSIAILKRRLVFRVVNPPNDALLGLPCLKPSKPYGYLWALPCCGSELGHALGWELGLAFLRLKLSQGSAATPEELDPAPLELSVIAASCCLGNGRRSAAMAYHEGFFGCIGTFLDHALNCRQTLPELRRRLLALDDAALRRRCLAYLDGKPVVDIFAPESLGYLRPARAGGKP